MWFVGISSAGRTWKDLEMKGKEALGCCKLSLMGLSVSFEDQNADRNVDSRGLTHEVSEGKGDSVENWARGYSC